MRLRRRNRDKARPWEVLTMVEKNDHADSGWDDYAERVLRNEGRLQGLEVLVAETREADRKLIEQRSESLARELERRAEALLELVTARADAVLSLSKEEREADRREVQLFIEQHQHLTVELKEGIRREGDITLRLLREVYDTAIHDSKSYMRESLEKNYEQSQAAIHELELRRQAATEKVEQMVRQWRESDREARELFAAETQRHLETLNHNNERISHILSNSVTRELWQSEKDASIGREGVLRDQLVNLEKSMLGMTPLSLSDKTHQQMTERMLAAVDAQQQVCNNRFAVLDDKIGDLKESRDVTTGKSTGRGEFYAWMVAAVTLLISIIVLANAFLNAGGNG